MKEIGGIQTPYDTCIVPYHGPGDSVGTKDIGGVDWVRDGQKGVTGEMPEVSGVTLPDDKSPGTGRPDIPGS